MTMIAIASCIFIVLGFVALTALIIHALRSKPGFRRRGCCEFEGVDRRGTRDDCDDCDDSTAENSSGVASLDGTIIKTQQLKGNE